MKYQGLDCIMPEITMMASNERNPHHEQHIYDYFTATEKFVRIAVPQLFVDCMEQFKTELSIEIETYLNGQHIKHGDIEPAIADMLQKAIGNTRITIEL